MYNNERVDIVGLMRNAITNGNVFRSRHTQEPVESLCLVWSLVIELVTELHECAWILAPYLYSVYIQFYYDISKF